MTEPITLEQLKNASLDAKTLEQVINGDDNTDVTSRLGATYPTLDKALKMMLENGLLGATPFATYQAMTASSLGNDSYAVVTNDDDISKNGVYQKINGLWAYSKYNAQQYVSTLKDSIAITDSNSVRFTDLHGFVIAELSASLLKIYDLVEIVPSSSFAVTDNLGFVINSDTNTRLLQTITLAEPIFAKTLCVFDGAHISIDVPSLVKERALQYQTNQLTATVSNAYNKDNLAYTVTSSRQLKINTAQLADNIHLTLRDSAQDLLTQMPIAIKKAPSTPKSPKILIVGDSISNRGLGDMLQQILARHGHNPQFIGTMRGASASSTNANDSNGQLGEAREGWETGDYTYQVDDRAQIVAVGSEQAYLTMSKTEQWARNPFLRQATPLDPTDIVRNGYVFDPVFYQSRFGLDKPDVVVIQLGTNDIRDRDNPSLVTNFIDNMSLMIKQIKKSWSGVKVIVSLPNTANDSERNKLWELEYHPLLRALLTLDAIICPTWALQSSENGYVITPNPNAASVAAIDSVTGALYGRYADAIHPYYSTRYEMAHAIAPYIICAVNNLI